MRTTRYLLAAAVMCLCMVGVGSAYAKTSFPGPQKSKIENARRHTAILKDATKQVARLNRGNFNREVRFQEVSARRGAHVIGLDGVQRLMPYSKEYGITFYADFYNYVKTSGGGKGPRLNPAGYLRIYQDKPSYQMKFETPREFASWWKKTGANFVKHAKPL
jgi:hypothetical protein